MGLGAFIILASSPNFCPSLLLCTKCLYPTVPPALKADHQMPVGVRDSASLYEGLSFSLKADHLECVSSLTVVWNQRWDSPSHCEEQIDLPGLAQVSELSAGPAPSIPGSALLRTYPDPAEQPWLEVAVGEISSS